jgi:parallel beta-helix repeat protein
MTRKLMLKTHHAFIIGAAAICTLAPAAHARPAVPVSCGDVITKDTRVANDLENCPGSGLVIGAPGITLDLNSHRIDGDATLSDGNPEAGVDNTAGHNGVTIKNGAIREFDVGVSLPEVSNNRLRGVRVFRNAILGMDLDLADHSVIEDSSFTDNGADFGGPGIFVIGGHHNRIEDNRAARNGGAGLVQSDSNDGRIEGNSFVSNGDGGLALVNSADNRVRGNLLARNVFAGILIEADRNDVSRNRALQDDNGIIVVGNENAIVHNRVSGPPGCSDDECGFGISFEGGSGNLIADNTVVGSPVAGIRLADFVPDTPEAVHNFVRRNVVLNAGVDGILVEATATDTLLEGNFARGAGDDGIDVDSPEATLTRNAANRNRDLGIEAVPGVTDGGGNRANGNGNPAQCTGVICGA